MNHKTHIGDGKMPNKYWVFHYDEKFKHVKNDDGSISIEGIKEEKQKSETKDSLLGEFKTYKEALQCVDRGAFLPHIVIEDRITGQVFDSMCIVCQDCGKEDYETFESIRHTKKEFEEKGIIFI